MHILKMVRSFYILLTIYMLLIIGSTSLDLYDVALGIIIMWVNYIMFSAGYRLRNIQSHFLNTNLLVKKDSKYSRYAKLALLLIAFFSIFISIETMKFYTGQTPSDVFRNLLSGTSVYYEYMRYFKEAQLSVLSISKIPYVIMMFIRKFIILYSYLALLIFKKELSKFERFYFVLITVAALYVGIARGTNFEMFEYVILIFFIALSRKKYNIHRTSYSTIRLSLLFISFGILALLGYFKVLELRGVSFDYSITSEIHYDPNGIFSVTVPIISFISISLFGYFGFGLYYLSRFASNVWLVSMSNFLAGFFPMGFSVFGSGNVQNSMRNTVDMGARWHPDTALLINDFGYLGLLLICFCLGIIVKQIYNRTTHSVLSELSGFIIFFQMMSLPVGNFVLAASAYKLMILFLILRWFWSEFIKGHTYKLNRRR